MHRLLHGSPATIRQRYGRPIRSPGAGAAAPAPAPAQLTPLELPQALTYLRAAEQVGHDGGELRTWGGGLLRFGTGGHGRFARNAVVQAVRPRGRAPDAAALLTDALAEAAGR